MERGFLPRMVDGTGGPDIAFSLPIGGVENVLLYIDRSLTLEANSWASIATGDGKQTRSFTHAKDAARAMLQLLEHHPNTGPINIGRDAEISMRELAEAINRIGGFEKKIAFDPSKPVGAPRKACDPARLLKLLPDFTFNYDTKAGLEEMVRAHLRQASGLN